MTFLVEELSRMVVLAAAPEADTAESPEDWQALEPGPNQMHGICSSYGHRVLV